MASKSRAENDRAAADLTTFVGRRTELGEIRQLLGTSRLVTLTGAGGVGKTRLALRAADETRRAFADGVFVVELASLSDPALLSHTVLDALAIPKHPTRPPTEVLAEHLRDRRALLVLDNCEHLVAAVADLVARLLSAAPELQVLATSRQSLAVGGEHVYPVPPLPVPHPDTVSAGQSAFASVALFADRATSVVAGFRLTEQNLPDVVRICRELEGIPLAIELAAARLTVLSVAELADRLGDRLRLLTRANRNSPDRHRTLEATIDYSHSLCSDAERLLWARVSVFSGGFTLDAAEAVCSDDDLPRDDILDTLAALTEKSILLREEAEGGRVRFRMLEILREYGVQRLRGSDEVERYRRRHRDWCLDLIDRVCAEWFGPRQADWAARLRREHPNLRAALDYTLSRPDDHDIALRMAGRPWFWWLACGFVTEGSFWLHRALDGSAEPTRDRAWALATAAYVSVLRGDERTSAAYVMQSLEIGRGLGDSSVVAYATNIDGLRAFVTGDLRGAVARWHHSLDLFGSTTASEDYPNGVRVQLAIAYLLLDELDNAERVVRDLDRRCRDAGESWLLSYAINADAFAKLSRGELDDAEMQVQQALTIKRSFHDDLGMAFVLDVMAWTFVARGRYEDGVVLVHAAARLWQSFGDQLWGSELMLARRHHYTEVARRALGNDAYNAASARGAGMSLDEVLDYALAGPAAAADGASAIDSPPGWDRLTNREREVAELVAEGRSNRDIAATLVISVRTVEAHVEHTLAKLGLESRTQVAAQLALRRRPAPTERSRSLQA